MLARSVLCMSTYHPYHINSDNDPDERFATFKRFLPFSFVFTASKQDLCNDHSTPPKSAMPFDIIMHSLIHNTVYCVEVFLRMIGNGIYDFFHKPWNV